MIHEIGVALVKFETGKSDVDKLNIPESQKATMAGIVREMFRYDVNEIINRYKKDNPRPLVSPPRDF